MRLFKLIKLFLLYADVLRYVVSQLIFPSIASHKRLKGEIGQFSTKVDHMHDHHRSYLDHNPENNTKWAEVIGSSTEKYVAYVLENNVEKKALNILILLYNLWIKVYEKTVEESTFVKTVGIFRNHILTAMGAYKIDKINVDICQRHVDEWMERLLLYKGATTSFFRIR